MTNPAVEVAKEQATEITDGIHTLSTGVKVRIVPVSPSLVLDVMMRVKMPEPPIVTKGNKSFPNPLDPHYAASLEQYGMERGKASLDAMAMFGLELVDGVPQDTEWITKLKLIGIEIDSDDKVSCEFYYKKYIALGGNTDILNEIQALMGITPEDVEKAKKA